MKKLFLIFSLISTMPQITFTTQNISEVFKNKNVKTLSGMILSGIAYRCLHQAYNDFGATKGNTEPGVDKNEYLKSAFYNSCLGTASVYLAYKVLNS